MIESRRFHIWGAGGHGKVVADAIRCAGGEVVGYIDSNADKVGEVVDGCGGEVVLSQDDFEAMLERGERPADWEAAIVAIGHNETRLAFTERLEPEETPTVIHPSATIAQSATIERGSFVSAKATINPGARVGTGVIVNTGAIVEHDSVVGDGVHIAPHVAVCGVNRVGALTLMGAGSSTIPCVEIGRECTIGAGAAVVEDIPDGATAVGVPARVVD